MGEAKRRPNRVAEAVQRKSDAEEAQREAYRLRMLEPHPRVVGTGGAFKYLTFAAAAMSMSTEANRKHK